MNTFRRITATAFAAALIVTGAAFTTATAPTASAASASHTLEQELQRCSELSTTAKRAACTSAARKTEWGHKAYTIAYVNAQLKSGTYRLTPARVASFKRLAKAYGTTYRFERDAAVCEATIKPLLPASHKNYGKGDPMARALSDCINMVISSNYMTV